MPGHAAPPSVRPRRPRVTRWLSRAVRGRRPLAAALVLALTAPLAAVTGVVGAQAAPTSAPLVVEQLEVTGGATLTSPQPAASPSYARDTSWTAGDSAATVELAASYRCASDTLHCPGAAATFVLDRLRLDAAVAVPGGLDVDPVIAYWADAAATVPAATFASAVAFTVEFREPLDGGGTGLVAGTTGTLAVRTKVVAPTAGGPQTGSAVVTTVPAADGALPSRVRVSTEFPVSLATTTTLSWAKDGYLSGVDAGADSPTNTATVTSTLTGDPADALTVSWPAAPATRPAAGTVGMLTDLTSAVVSTWPTGAAQVQVTGWRWTGPSSAPAQVDLGTVLAPTGGATATGDLLAALTTADRAALTGLRLVFTAADGSTIPTGTASVLTVDVREHGSVDSTPVPRGGSADYVTDAPAGAFDAASDLNTLTVTASAATVARRGTQTSVETSQSRAFRVSDPRAYAGSATTLVPLAGGTLYGGGFVLGTSSGTNWSRRAVEELVVQVRPDQADVTATNGLLDPDLPAVDARTFGSGLTFAGFGAARDGGGTGPAADGSGASLVGLAGTGAVVTLRVTASSGTPVPFVLDAEDPTPALPTTPGDLGLTAWSQVTGFTVTVDGGGAVVPMGASVTVPYLLRSATSASPQTYANHTRATTRLGSDTSRVLPRTARSGNRPVTAATVAVAVPTVGVEGGKEVVEPYVSTTAGSTVQTVLTATARPGGSNHLPDTLVVEDSARATSGSTTATAWWNILQPTSIRPQAGTVTVVDYYTTVVSGVPQWTRYSDDLTTLVGADTWRGFRVTSTRTDGEPFTDRESVRTAVTFAVRTTPLAAWPGDRVLRNVATVTSTRVVEGFTVTSTPYPVTDRTTGVVPGVGGTPALVKHLASPRSGVEGMAGTNVATLTWGTAGTQQGSVVVADGNGLADGVATPSTGRADSFWDTLDLTRVRPITSGDVASPGSAYDPYLVFDAVADVQVFDVTDGQWHSLATHELSGGVWGLKAGARSDVTFGGTVATGDFPYRGSFPGVTIQPVLRERVGGVRLVYAPRTDAERAANVPTDWRTALPAVPDGVVAPTPGLAREVQLEVALRDRSRFDGTPVNDAFAYTGGTDAGRVTNSGRVTGWTGDDGTGSATDLGGPVNGADDRTFRVTPASLGVSIDKTWLRDANGEPLTTSELGRLGLPVGAGAPDSEYPTATVTVTARSTSSTRVDAFTVTEPAGIDAPGAVLGADDPFARFAMTDLVTITDLAGSGATSTDVVLYRAGPGGTVTEDPVLTRAAALALPAGDLVDIVGVQVRYRGRIAVNATATLQVGTRLLAQGRVDGEAPQDVLADRGDLTVVDVARATVEDARVCANETGTTTPIATCTTTAPLSRDDDAQVTVHEPDVEAFPALAVSPADVQRDAADPAVAVTLSAQNFGLSEADELLVTDADARFFNAVAAETVRLDRLPSGAEEAELEVVLADGTLDVGPYGTYTGTLAWQSFGIRTALGSTWDLAALAAAEGATADDVVAVRVRFRSTAGSRIAAPGQGFGQAVLDGRLREELRTGGLPSALGAADWTFRGDAELTANPGESVRGRVSNRVSATAIRGGLAAAENWTSVVPVAVHAGAATVDLQKTELDVQGRKPGDAVQYRITVRNTASGTTAADLTGLVVTDVLPEDGSLEYGTAPGGGSPWQVQGLGGGPSPIGDPTVTVVDGTVRFAWDDDDRLAAGAGVEVLLWLTVSRDLSTSTVVNAALATSANRPPVAAPTGADGGTACRAGTYDATSATCRVTAAALTIGGANVYVSEEWVRAAGASSAVRTVGGAAACTPRGAGAGDRDWYRYPCAVVTEAGATTQWQVQVTSRATVGTDRLEIVDMLSQVGDYAAMDARAGSSRGSAWRPVWDGVVPAVVAAPVGATAEIYTTTADYRSGGLAPSSDFDPVPGTWSSTPLTPGSTVPAAVAARVTGFKVVLRFAAGDLLSSGESVRLQWAMRTPLSGATSSTDTWNSFAFRVPANPAAGRPLDVMSVPLKAGARFMPASTTDPLVAVGDRVWLDTDRDGIQDPGEPGVGGVVVDVYQGTGAGATWVAEATTDATGEYLVDGLPAGTYELRLTLPPAVAALHRFTADGEGADDVDSDAVPDGAATAVISPVVLPAAISGTTVAVADMPTAWQTAHAGLAATFVDTTRDGGLQRRWLAVGDRVWFDVNRDGRQDLGEDPVPGVTVRLLDATTDALVATTTTAPDGSYAFGRLEPGTYVVEVRLPASLSSRWTFTAPGVGAGDGDSDPVAVTGAVGRTAPFTLTEGAGGRMVAAGSLPTLTAWSDLAAGDAEYADPTLDAGLAERPVTVGDRVWVDLDGDGVQDAGEPGLAGVVLTLSAGTTPGGPAVTDAAGATVGTVTTDAGGAYAFTGLLPGTYTVAVDPVASAGVLEAFRESPTGGPDPATDSSAGSSTSRALLGGEQDTTLDFGFRPLRALGDTVWFDVDRDGVQDDGEPGMPGVTVRLLDDATSAELATTTTDADGRYRFDLLEPGAYRVQVELTGADAARYTFTTTGAGTAAGADSDVEQDGVGGSAAGPGAGSGSGAGAGVVATTRTVTVGPGQPGERATTAADGLVATLVDPTWDAGVVERTVQVGHVVWFDEDEDGLQGADEPGLPGVVLTLTTPDGRAVTDATGTPVGPATTDADGRYTFTGLLPGRYVVAVDRIASATALRGYAPTTAEVGADRALDSSTWTVTSALLVGGEQDTTLDFGLVLADDVQLALRKTAVARDGDLVTWEVTVASTGTQDAYAGFTVVDTLPAGMAYVSGSGDGFVCATGTGTGTGVAPAPTAGTGDRVVTCRLDGPLASGDTATLRVVTRLTDPRADVANTATVTTAGHGYLFEVAGAESLAWSDAPPLPPAAPVVDLPRTGADVAGTGLLALLLLLLGGTLVVAVRRGRA
ncbi:SdrD B-like domain-containing protein [Cellulomonas biazotea]|uniref:Gram-positive cocci surface proteins LPxTG domain-containing protein n=1 Tax=Cellulomonas biazotea TaxID=1709 RepID=A0A402DS23_9CELL|nr:SdrD B-like domain-containing protein [Cellulomonas biazotea]GCE76876.1 hypothetical protein CBZ_19320 [Cellulomonas biazotea]